ncbi:Ankyrin repeat protein [Apiospora rasikravindrae]|uniref:Ankyrin repeat protein n=1 Tax=Apiospora rasikravindrae TaxID=990691 RepID=A0ABR1SIV2_9PEZI
MEEYLAYYAARYWAEHAKVVELSQKAPTPVVVDFLSLQETVSLSYLYYAPDDDIHSPLGTTQRVESYPPADPRRISALYYAACTGLVYSAMQMLRRGAALNTSCGKLGTALRAAALNGEMMLVEQLLEDGAPIDAQFELFSTALQAPAGLGDESMVRLLLERGAAIDARSELCGTALEVASGEGRWANARLLLEMGAEIGYALHAAARSGHRDIIRLLLDKGAKLDMRDDYRFTPLRWAEIKRQPMEILGLLGHQGVQKATSLYNL